MRRRKELAGGSRTSPVRGGIDHWTVGSWFESVTRFTRVFNSTGIYLGSTRLSRVYSRKGVSAMTAPQTPRRSDRQQKLPARYGGGILISTSQAYKWPTDPLHTRPAQPTDFLQDETFEPGDTHFYSSLVRHGPPSRLIVRTYGKQKPAKPVASGSKSSETFSVGDTVLVASTNKTPSVAVITALWRTVRDDDEGGDDDDSSESMRIRVHWFVRPAQLGSIRQKRDALPVSSLSLRHELLTKLQPCARRTKSITLSRTQVFFLPRR